MIENIRMNLGSEEIMRYLELKIQASEQGVEQITLSYTFHRAKDPVNPASTGTN